VRVGGCDFAADPGSQADPAPIIWMPAHNPRLALLTEAPALLPIGPTLEAARLREILAAPEGAYAELSASLTAHQVLVLGVTSPSVPVAIVVPLDRLFEDRVDAARRLWRALSRGATATPPAFSAQRQRRLKLVLRALDADLAGVGYRDIALVLFGERVPRDAAWRTHALRSFTIRLVQDGRALMRGGYLRLLRPDRRKR
jgi:hypothetical protein